MSCRKNEGEEKKYIELEYNGVELYDVLVQFKWTYWYDETIRDGDYDIQSVDVLEFEYRYEDDEVLHLTKEEIAEFIYQELCDENSKIFKELMVE